VNSTPDTNFYLIKFMEEIAENFESNEFESYPQEIQNSLRALHHGVLLKMYQAQLQDAELSSFIEPFLAAIETATQSLAGPQDCAAEATTYEPAQPFDAHPLKLTMPDGTLEGEVFGLYLNHPFRESCLSELSPARSELVRRFGILMYTALGASAISGHDREWEVRGGLLDIEHALRAFDMYSDYGQTPLSGPLKGWCKRLWVIATEMRAAFGICPVSSRARQRRDLAAGERRKRQSLVEAVGVEPTSEKLNPEASTCVSSSFFSRLRA